MLLHRVYTEVAPTMMGFVLLKAASVSFGRSRCSWTSSGGVTASH